MSAFGVSVIQIPPSIYISEISCVKSPLSKVDSSSKGQTPKSFRSLLARWGEVNIWGLFKSGLEGLISNKNVISLDLHHSKEKVVWTLKYFEYFLNISNFLNFFYPFYLWVFVKKCDKCNPASCYLNSEKLFLSLFWMIIIIIPSRDLNLEPKAFSLLEFEIAP